MENFMGKWESVPCETKNFEAFCDKMGVPADKREGYKNMVTIITNALDGDTLVFHMEIKGTPIKEDLRFKLGVPLDYKGFDQSDMTSVMKFQGDKFIEHHKSVTGGVSREWDVERRVEGDKMIAVSTKDGVCMTTVLKRI